MSMSDRCYEKRFCIDARAPSEFHSPRRCREIFGANVTKPIQSSIRLYLFCWCTECTEEVFVWLHTKHFQQKLQLMRKLGC